jgi:hypothetical protein
MCAFPGRMKDRDRHAGRLGALRVGLGLLDFVRAVSRSSDFRPYPPQF